MLHISVLVMNRTDTTESAIFMELVYSLLPQDLTFQNMFTVELQKLQDLWVHVVVLLFYVQGKHLRSCRDGQLT